MCVQGRSLAQIRRGAVPHEQVPVPGVNSGVNVVDPGPSVPIQSKCVCKVSLYIEMKLCIYHIFRKLIFVLAVIRLMERNKFTYCKIFQNKHF